MPAYYVGGRGGRRGAETFLRPPPVIGAGIVFRPIQTFFSQTQERPLSIATGRRGPHSNLRDPAVVGAGIAFHGPGVRLADTRSPRQLNPRRTTYNLKPPTVTLSSFVVTTSIGALVQVKRTSRRAPHSNLSEPAVIGAGIVFRPIFEHLAYSRRGKTKSVLSKPVVIGAGIAFYGPLVHLVPSTRISRRARPFYVGPFVVFAQLNPLGGTLVQYDTSTALNRRWRDVTSKLSPPVVTQVAQTFIGPDVHLALSRRGVAKSHLAPPIIPPLASPLSVSFVITQGRRRRLPHSNLEPPAVIGAGIVFEPVFEHLAYSRRGRPRSVLFEPAVIGAGIVFRGVFVWLTYSKRGRPTYFLRSPVIPPEARPIESVVAVQLVRGREERRLAYPHLSPPAVIGAGIVFAPVTEHLAYSRRGEPRSILFEPAVVGAGIVFRDIQVWLTYSKRGRPKSFLASPIIPALAPPVEEKIVTQLVRVELAARQPHSHLYSPAVIGGGIYFYPVRVELAYSRRGRPKSELFPPAVVAIAQLTAPVLVHLAYARRGRPKSELFSPVVIGGGIVFRPIAGRLTYSRRGRPKSDLFPPAVVGAGVAFREGLVWLAYSRRGRPKSILQPPIIPPVARPIETVITVQLVRGREERRLAFPHLSPPALIGGGIYFYPVKTWLAYSRRGKPKSELFAPAVVGAGITFRNIFVWLTYSKRGRPKSFLLPPVIPPIARPVETVIATQLVRGREERRLAYPRLAPPAVIGAGIVFRRVSIWLAYSRRGKPKSELLPPAVVGAGIVFAPVEVHLAPSKRGLPKSHLFPPILPSLAPPVEEKLVVQLVRVLEERRLAFSHLGPPAVVGAGIVFRPLDVELTYSRRGVPKSTLFKPAVITAAAVANPIAVHLAYSRRGQAKPFFIGPLVIGPNPLGGILVQYDANTARDRRWRDVTTRLSQPVVVQVGQTFVGPEVHLAPSRRGKPKSFLAPPIIPALAPPIETGIAVKFVRAYEERRLAFPKLFGPAVIGAGIVFRPIAEHLAPSHQIERQRRYHSFLEPPTVVQPATLLFFGPKTWLTYSRRGKPKSILFAPVVIGAGIVFTPIRGHLAYSRRGRPRSQFIQAFLPPPLAPIEEKIAVQLVRGREERRLAFPHLSPPAVVGGGIYFYPVKTWLAYSRRGKPKSELFSPAVVGAGIVFRPIDVTLSPSRRGRPESFLRPPAVVPTPSLPTLRVNLARIRPAHINSVLREPAVVATPVTFRGIQVSLAPSSRIGRAVHSDIGAPIVVTQLEAIGGIGVNLVRIRPPRVTSYLYRPAVVSSAVTSRPIDVTLAPSKRGKPESFLRPPVLPPLAPPVHEAIVSNLVRVEFAGRQPHSKLFSPAVVGGGIVFAPVKTWLTYSRRGKPKSELFAPAVIGAGITFRDIFVWLAYSKRGRPLSRLAPPVIPPVARPVEAVIAVQLVRGLEERRLAYPRLAPPAVVGGGIYFYPVRTWLAYSRRGRPKSTLFAPAVIGSGIVFREIFVWLTYSKRGRPKSQLFPPIILLTAPPIKTEIAVQLVRGREERRLAFPRLFPPAVIGAGIVFKPILVHLAPSHQIGHQRRYESELRPPTVVQPLVLLFFGPKVTLAYSVRGKPRYALSGPIVVNPGVTFRNIVVWLAYSRRGRPRSEFIQAIIPPLAPPVEQKIAVQLVRVREERRLAFPHLSPPARVGAGIVFRRISVWLAYSRRGRPKSELFAPIIPPLALPVVIHLAYSRRGKPKSALFAPAVVGGGIYFRGILEQLAYSRRGKPFSKLRPPAVIGAGITFRGIDVELAPSHQIGRQRHYLSKLRPPTVVQPATLIFFGPETHLAYSRRGRPLSELRAPAIIGAGVYFRGILVHLAYSKRGKPKSFLLPPIIPALAQPIVIQLAPSRRPVTKSRLFLPVIPPTAPPVETELAVQLVRDRLERRLAQSRLTPPPPFAQVFAPISVHLARTVVPPTIARLSLILIKLPAPPLRIHLAPSRRPQVRSKLSAPAAVFAPFIAEPIRTQLVRITPPTSFPHLSPPAVVGDGIYFRGILVKLVRNKPQRTRYFLSLVQAPFSALHGDVCGFDTTDTDICDDTTTDTADRGATSSPSGVSGTTGSTSKIAGGTSSSSSVSGDVGKAK